MTAYKNFNEKRGESIMSVRFDYSNTAAFVSEEELANTIAHELNHCRSYLKGGDAPEETAYPAGDALASYIRGER